MSIRRISIIVGLLFIVQMFTAMVGTTMTQAFLDGNSDRSALGIGVALMICSGLSVVGIGVLSYRVLKAFNKKLAALYPVMRIVEFTVSAACSLYLLVQLQAVPNHMLWVYVPTAIGGLVFTYLLLVSSVVPQVIAWLGLVGYGSLLLGTLLDLSGVIDMHVGSGMLWLAVGGVFEVLVLPVWLIAKGFHYQPAITR